MFKQCTVKKCLVVLFFVVFGIYREFSCCNGTILSKGKITMCVKDKNNDPYNVVEGKGCDKKLVVTKSVSAEQVKTLTVDNNCPDELARRSSMTYLLCLYYLQ